MQTITCVILYVFYSQFYEPGAMLIEDEGMVIPGLLVGLNVIDCNMCIKEEDLDQPVCDIILFYSYNLIYMCVYIY
jgi:hypothetical protein